MNKGYLITTLGSYLSGVNALARINTGTASKAFIGMLWGCYAHLHFADVSSLSGSHNYSGQIACEIIISENSMYKKRKCWDNSFGGDTTNILDGDNRMI